MHMRSPPHAQLTGEPVEASDVGAFTCRGKSRNAKVQLRGLLKIGLL